MTGIDTETRMTIKTLILKGMSRASIARMLKLPESNVRYDARRILDDVTDRRRMRPRKAAGMAEAIERWMSHPEGGPINLAALRAWLVAEHDYIGSLRSVQRFVRTNYPPPPRGARRRFEAPSGAQAQLDWAIFPDMRICGESVELSALHLVLSHSRYAAIVWSRRRDQLPWLSNHNGVLRRIGGVPAIIRIDNDAPRSPVAPVPGASSRKAIAATPVPAASTSTSVRRANRRPRARSNAGSGHSASDSTRPAKPGAISTNSRPGPLPL